MHFCTVKTHVNRINVIVMPRRQNKNQQVMKFWEKSSPLIIEPSICPFGHFRVRFKNGFFGYIILRVSLLRIRKEWIQPARTRNIFTNTAAVRQHYDFIRFMGIVKSQYNRDLHCSSSQRQIAKQNCYTTSPARLATVSFPVDIFF